MLTVETIGRIRREHFLKGKTIKEIARDLRVSRNTVRKVLRSGETLFEYEREVQPRPKLGRWTEVLDALLVDTISRSDTYPAIDIRVDDVQLGHEATVSRVSEEQLFYLQSRGLPEDEAMAMIVRGFIEPIARELPMEYALELNKLIEMGMEGSVG